MNAAKWNKMDSPTRYELLRTIYPVHSETVSAMSIDKWNQIPRAARKLIAALTRPDMKDVLGRLQRELKRIRLGHPGSNRARRKKTT